MKRINVTKHFLTYLFHLNIQSVWEGGRQRANKSDAYSAEYCLFNPLSDWLAGGWGFKCWKRKVIVAWEKREIILREDRNNCEMKSQWEKCRPTQKSFDLMLFAPTANIGRRLFNIFISDSDAYFGLKNYFERLFQALFRRIITTVLNINI